MADFLPRWLPATLHLACSMAGVGWLPALQQRGLFLPYLYCQEDYAFLATPLGSCACRPVHESATAAHAKRETRSEVGVHL